MAESKQHGSQAHPTLSMSHGQQDTAERAATFTEKNALPLKESASIHGHHGKNALPPKESTSIHRRKKSTPSKRKHVKHKTCFSKHKCLRSAPMPSWAQHCSDG